MLAAHASVGPAVWASLIVASLALKHALLQGRQVWASPTATNGLEKRASAWTQELGKLSHRQPGLDRALVLGRQAQNRF